jgi:thiosulfate/3-mercaptopyruvate sulfurtransferase
VTADPLIDDPLIDAGTLAAALDGSAPPTLLDVRWRLGGPSGSHDYAAGHLPGAVFLDLDAQLCGPPGPGGRHPLPDPARLEAVLRAAGVREGHPVVIYDAGDAGAASQSAARAWWTLRWAGHAPTRVLDGGYAAWLAAGHPVTAVPAGPFHGDVTVRPGGMPVLDAAAAAELTGAGILIDVRAPERYRGEVEPIDPVAGHIPGAVNVPATAHLTADGRWRGGEQIRHRLARAGVADRVPVGAYCGSGVVAAHTVLALHRAGRTDAALYVGSWSHWVTDRDRPVATGEAP